MFKSLSLKAKLIISFGLMATMTLSMAMGWISSIKAIESDYSHVTDVNMPNTVQLSNMRAYFRDLRAALKTMNFPDLDENLKTTLLKDAQQWQTKYEEADRAYNTIPFGPGEEEIYKDVSRLWKEYDAQVTEPALAFIQSTDPKDKANLNELLQTTERAKASEFLAALIKLVQYQTVEAEKWEKKAGNTSATSSQIAIGSAVIGVIFSVLMTWLISTYLSKSLGSISTKINESAQSTTGASGELMVASQQLSAGSSESAASLEEIVASLEEVSSMIQINATNSKEASNLAQQSRKSAEDGNQEMARLIEAMDNIAKDSQKIEDIINVIDDIAFQTNLLALNAAVEAARAGEQGKGFAVVAEAVRSLAQRSAEAAKDIAQLIKESAAKSQSGQTIAQANAAALHQIVESIRKVSELNSEIANASNEQATGISQISQAMNQLDQASQGNAASSEQVSASAQNLSGQAIQLTTVVGQLKTLMEGDRAA